MANNKGVPGVGVTPLVGGKAVSSTNPLPVDASGGITAADVKFSSVVAITLGDTDLVAAAAGKKIRVLSWSADMNGLRKDFFFASDTLATPISPTYKNTLGGDLQAPGGVFETAVGEKLIIFATTIGGTVICSYVEI